MQTAISVRSSEFFRGRIDAKNTQIPIADPAAYQAMLLQVGSFPRRTDRMLEIGCGTRSTALRFSQAIDSGGVFFPVGGLSILMVIFRVG